MVRISHLTYIISVLFVAYTSVCILRVFYSKSTHNSPCTQSNTNQKPINSTYTTAYNEKFHKSPQFFETYSHGQRCSDAQILNIAQSLPHKRSRCPDNRAWIDSLLSETKHQASATIVSVGCNKGDDFVAQMRAWSGDETFSVVEYRALLQKKIAHRSNRACAALHEATVKVPKRKLSAYCIEPMLQNFQLLDASMRPLGYFQSVKLKQAAISSVLGVGFFRNAPVGTEFFGLEQPRSNAMDLTPVNITTIDNIVATESIISIDFLSIDTEGNDLRAILGAINTIAAQKVKYIEFEYHEVGRWKYSDLQDLIDLLDNVQYDCYWALDSGKLSRLTGCWHDSYYTERSWSNIACINRNLPHTHKRMQEIAGFT